MVTCIMCFRSRVRHSPAFASPVSLHVRCFQPTRNCRCPCASISLRVVRPRALLRRPTRDSAMRYCQLVIGPAGSGKSTYCSTIVRHCETLHRHVDVVNLDPAAERFDYPVSTDIRDLITLDDVAEELDYGPNGGLIYCMEFLMDNTDWLHEQIGTLPEDAYVIMDCPGQIELYSHCDMMRRLVDLLQQWDFRVCAVYMVDAQFVADTPKYFAGVLAAMSAMIQLELPHINVMSKMDTLGARGRRQDMDTYLVPEASEMLDSVNRQTSPKFAQLNKAIATLIDDYALVKFVPLNATDSHSIAYVLSHIDNALQYGEDLEVKEAREPDDE